MNKSITNHRNKIVNIINRNGIMQDTNRLYICISNHATKILPQTHFLFHKPKILFLHQTLNQKH
nr:MAG TPA: hypothetical protein [Microviridae sp.]